MAFDATGPADTIVHKETGYLAEPYDSADLPNGIEWVLADEEKLDWVGEKRGSEPWRTTTYTTLQSAIELFTCVLSGEEGQNLS